MYDFVIIGGGIIGMSTAMQLIDVYPDARIALLEKESAPACHQTGHNSGVIHAGVYYTPGSLKAQFCLAGNQATKTFCDQNNIRYDTCGKMLVATSELEMARMRALWERTAANGLEREWLSAAELREREPNIIGLGGIFVPSSGIVSYRDVATAMANRFQAKGGEDHLPCRGQRANRTCRWRCHSHLARSGNRNRYAYRLCRTDGGSAGQNAGRGARFYYLPFPRRVLSSGPATQPDR